MGSKACTHDQQNSLSENYCGNKRQADRKDSRSSGQGECAIGKGTWESSLSGGAWPDAGGMNHLGASFKRGTCLHHLYNFHA